MARRVASAVIVVVGALTLGACGSEGVQVSKSSPDHTGATLFAQRCGGCHTLDAAGTQGSATNVKDRERTDGPNFNTRHEAVPDVLYAIENGGFSGAIMPENVVTGAQAQAVAEFVSHYAGGGSSSSGG
jgi:mono/diheme cytochrome c family protein